MCSRRLCRLLQHYLFPQGGEGLHLVVDDKGRFREDNFQKAMAQVGGGADDGGGGGGGGTDLTGGVGGAGGKGGSKGKGSARAKKNALGLDLKRIISLIMAKKYDPVIVFSFSKRDCEGYAMQVSSAAEAVGL